ncbi:helix-turn-helix domain-containing protein [Sediminibacterium ginsengisoli]|uniref:Helix-turn-helix domain-containing protein n=1 Tax=Sediminibacterium ginsengisoli TaxID=413434 RepID=A0A1T4NYK4_9BACT|nr:helix-turn-helix transcriptional regulator [Sediminibacterium ginsengisoli]SJZ84157.1 Helix-turn-helix domain-containing protein [Sediminibacterium ginsengisoli]
MNLAFKLTSFREFKNWQREDVARELGLSGDSYEDLEEGRIRISGMLADKLSELYQAPAEFFLIDDTPTYLQAQVLYSNCTITSGYGGTSGYVNHLNNDRGMEEILYLRKQEVSSLKQQIEYLQNQNDNLIKMLAAKNRTNADLVIS